MTDIQKLNIVELLNWCYHSSAISWNVCVDFTTSWRHIEATSKNARQPKSLNVLMIPVRNIRLLTVGFVIISCIVNLQTKVCGILCATVVTVNCITAHCWSAFTIKLLNLFVFAWFLPRDAMHKRGLCRHAVSVCLSVCVSVTFVHCVKTKIIFNFFHRSSFSAPNGMAILRRESP